MNPLHHSFEWRGTTITVQKPNGFSRQKRWKLNSFVTSIEDAQLREFAMYAGYYLANTVSVEGDTGFPVPNGNVTQESFVAFCNGLGHADEGLLIAWDDALDTAQSLSNDADLLPPDALPEKKEQTP